MAEYVHVMLDRWMAMSAVERRLYSPHVIIDLDCPYDGHRQCGVGEFEEYENEAKYRGLDGRGFNLQK